MEREVNIKGYVARKSERAIEELLEVTLKNLSLKAEVSKFAHNEDGDSRETKWDVHLKNESDAIKLSETLDIPHVDVIYYGELEGAYVVTFSLCWDVNDALEQLNIEKKIVLEIEGLLNTLIYEGVEDIEILKGSYYWGYVETLTY